MNGGPCGGWDGPTARALWHPAFLPFSWPMLRDTSPSYVDVKVYSGNEILFSWIFRGYRADTSSQMSSSCEVLTGRPRLSVVIAAFSAWKVSVFSFECGGPIYWVGPGRTVMSADCARSRWELRVSDQASTDAVSNDADCVEFRYHDANNKMDLKCSRTSVPGWGQR